MRIIWVVIIAVFVACDDSINVQLNDSGNNIIIEGWITDELKHHEVFISRLNGFSSNEPNPLVTDAEVVLLDNETAWHYHFANDRYISDSIFQGVNGNSYQLEVYLANGIKIVSEPELMVEAPPIDTVGYDFYVEPDPDDPRNEITIYYPIAFLQDPPNIKNYYLWTVYRNDSLFDGVANLVLLEDRFINGNYLSNEFTDFDFKQGDIARIDVHSVSNATFSFFRLFKSQTLNIGQGSASTPAALIGNLTNLSNRSEDVLGFFGTKSIKSKSTVISPQ
jgi:hypothetical protein